MNHPEASWFSLQAFCRPSNHHLSTITSSSRYAIQLPCASVQAQFMQSEVRYTSQPRSEYRGTERQLKPLGHPEGHCQRQESLRRGGGESSRASAGSVEGIEGDHAYSWLSKQLASGGWLSFWDSFSLRASSTIFNLRLSTIHCSRISKEGFLIQFP